jgi:hypothetical protein
MGTVPRNTERIVRNTVKMIEVKVCNSIILLQAEIALIIEASRFDRNMLDQSNFEAAFGRLVHQEKRGKVPKQRASGRWSGCLSPA